MSLLLAADEVELFAPAVEADEHGWTLPGDVSYWSGVGNLQLGPGFSQAGADAGGGHGPHGPAADNTGVLFLPPEPELVDGTTAVVRGLPYVLSQCRQVADPIIGGTLACWQATATGAQ